VETDLAHDLPVKHAQYDSSALPKANNRRSFMDSPLEMVTSDFSWPLSSPTSGTQTSPWTQEPSNRLSSVSRRESTVQSALRGATFRSERPASWNPRWMDFDLSTVDSRRRSEDEVEEHQKFTMESVFKSLKLSESPELRTETPPYRPQRGGYFDSASETQKLRLRMARIVSERGLNPTQFDVAPKHARYFVIKSYNVWIRMHGTNIRKTMY
jgi:hypothetical protein